MQKDKIRYYLGIDGGGTKTLFLLEDEQGETVAQVTLGPSNPNDIGPDACTALLESGIGAVCHGIDKREISMFAGIAGCMSNPGLFQKFFARYEFGRSAHGSDLENARELALHGQDGVAVILGTGSIAYAQKSGVCKRIGGWGYLLDRAGSGYDLGRDALHAALCAIDGTGEETVLRPLLENHLKKPLPDAIPEIYAGGKRLIASCAPLLFKACDLGDGAALRILDQNAARIAQLLRTGQAYVGSGDAPLVLLGGLCARKDLIEPLVRRHLDLPNPICFSEEPMVKGAIMLARKEKMPC